MCRSSTSSTRCQNPVAVGCSPRTVLNVPSASNVMCSAVGVPHASAPPVAQVPGRIVIGHLVRQGRPGQRDGARLHAQEGGLSVRALALSPCLFPWFAATGSDARAEHRAGPGWHELENLLRGWIGLGPDQSTEGDMTKVLVKGLIVASVAAAVGITLNARPSLAHNDWGLPLVGGLAGGFALSSMMGQREHSSREYEQPVYAAPRAGLRRTGAGLRGPRGAGGADRQHDRASARTCSMTWLRKATSPRASTRPAARRC